jgi:hypothetical protein
MPNFIRKLKIDEISLVRTPANTGARIVLHKSAGDDFGGGPGSRRWHRPIPMKEFTAANDLADVPGGVLCVWLLVSPDSFR